jgi:hypothetical protein
MHNERLGVSIQSLILGQERSSDTALSMIVGCNQSTIAVEVGSKDAASSAAARDGGSSFPRFSARRRMPRHAFALK